MNLVKRETIANFIAYTPIAAGGFGCAVGVLVMLGWLFDIDTLQTIIPGLASMKFNTALLFLLVSVYILLIKMASIRFSKRFYALPIVVLIISGVSLLQYLFGFDAGIDQLFILDPVTDALAFPGRMSAGTALAFMLLGMALLTYRAHARLGETLAVIAHFISLVAIFGYLFDVQSLYDVFLFNTMAIHTAVTFMVLSLGVIFLIPNGFISNLVSGDGPGSITMRHLIPTAIIVPVALGWLSLQGVYLNWYQPLFALVVMTVMMVGVLTLLIINYALTIRQWYRRQMETRNRLLQSEISRVELEKARELTDMKEQFFAMLSHDMRTPLSSIILSTDILTQYSAQLDESRRADHLERVHHNAYKLLNLIEDIMLLCKSQLGDIQLNIQYSNIADFCRTAFEEFTKTEAERSDKHRFDLNVLDHDVDMGFDNKLLQRVLSNLLRNAVKYSPDGGTVQLTLTKADSYVNIAISDTGIGIPEDSQQDLFSLFHRASNVGQIPGYGLGLVIVKQIVEAHHGKVTVESIEGKGTTFSITLPINRAAILTNSPAPQATNSR